jgi:hypothetical protein
MANVLPDPSSPSPQGPAPVIPTFSQADTVAHRDAARWAEVRRRALADPAIARALRDQRALLRMGAGQAPDPAAEIGGGSPGKKLDEEARKGAAALAQLSSAAGMAFAAGAGGIASLGATAGAMSSWPTFKASITGVSIELGQAFLPYIDRASLALQDMERWLETLSPSTKEFGARLAITGTAAAGAAFAAAKLVGAWRAVAAAAGLANTAMAMGPIGGTIAVVGTAVAALAGAWALTARNARDAADAQADAGRAGSGAAAGGPEPSAAQTIAALPPGVRAEIERARAAGDDGKKIQEIIAREKKAAEEALAAATRGGAARGAAATAVDAEEEAALRRNLAGRPAMDLPEADRARFREDVLGREVVDPATGARRRVWDRDVPMNAAGDPTAARELAREGRAAGRYRTDAEEKEAQRRFEERFRRERAGLPTGDVAARRAVDGPVREAEARLRAAEAASRRTGADSDRLTRDYAGLPQARITDAPAMADAVQIKALQQQDKTAENQAKQLGELGSIRTEIVGMRSDITALRTVFPVSYGRHGRADGRGDTD